MLVRMSSRPPFTPEPQKRDDQILAAKRIAGEAVVRIVPSNSFDRCNYATSASDRRAHEVLNWCPRSNSRTFNSPRPGRVAFPPDTPAALSSSPRLTAHPMVTAWSGSCADKSADGIRHRAASQSRSIEVRRPAISCSAAGGAYGPNLLRTRSRAAQWLGRGRRYFACWWACSAAPRAATPPAVAHNRLV
jgi:hypothetical protein